MAARDLGFGAGLGLCSVVFHPSATSLNGVSEYFPPLEVDERQRSQLLVGRAFGRVGVRLDLVPAAAGAHRVVRGAGAFVTLTSTSISVTAAIWL